VQINLEITFDHAGSTSRITWPSVKEKAAYLALKALSSPFERERTQSIFWRQSCEQYRLRGFFSSEPQERHFTDLVVLEGRTILLLKVRFVEVSMDYSHFCQRLTAASSIFTLKSSPCSFFH
jgi:hypothetical protein